MTTTKDKILQSSIKLFNEYGVGSVRLQQIADETNISVGNLAYHYKNKEAIVASVYEKLFDDFREILSSYLQTPSLLDFDKQVSLFFDFFQTYRFYISDLFSEHSLPEVRTKWQVLMNKLILQIRNRIDFHVKQGDFLPESDTSYNILAENIWLIMVFWIPQQLIMQKHSTEKHYKRTVWQTIKPYLTDKGKNDFANVFSPNSIH